MIDPDQLEAMNERAKARAPRCVDRSPRAPEEAELLTAMNERAKGLETIQVVRVLRTAATFHGIHWPAQVTRG